VLGKLGRIPNEHEFVEAQGVRLEVKKMDGMRIAWLSLQRIGKDEPGLPGQTPTQSLSEDISKKAG